MTDHIWTTISRHPTSDGVVLYESCPCGLVRIRLAETVAARIEMLQGTQRAGATGRRDSPVR